MSSFEIPISIRRPTSAMQLCMENNSVFRRQSSCCMTLYEIENYRTALSAVCLGPERPEGKEARDAARRAIAKTRKAQSALDFLDDGTSNEPSAPSGVN